jgi:hypothetical protein
MERRSYVQEIGSSFVVGQLGLLTRGGWVVTRTDTAGGVTIYQLERPRYLAVAEQLEFWWRDLMVRTGAAPPPTPTPVPKPTEAPKPAAPPAASPRVP